MMFFPPVSRGLRLVAALCAAAVALAPVRADNPQTIISLQTLYTFRGNGDGSLPFGGLTAGGDGFFYGTTVGGGISGHTGGTVFRLAPDGTLFTLSSFLAGAPYTAPTLAVDGNFYGTATLGGEGNGGFVFRTAPNGTSTRIIGSFTSTTTGVTPYASLFEGSDGGLYGTTTSGTGAAADGGVFQIQRDGTLRVLHLFNPDGSEGTLPYGELVQGRDGDYYGTTSADGPHGGGTVFRVTTLGLYTTVYAFTGDADGGSPRAALLLGSDGNFYGTTSAGGLNNQGSGTAFQLNLRALPAVPGTLAFSADGTNVDEGAGLATLTVTRTGGSTGAVSVGYTTADGTARAGVDFLAVSGKLAWAAGDTAPKQIKVPITDGNLSDNSTRTFSVRFLTATGGATLGAASETVNILEDDAVRPTTVTLSVLGDGMAVVGGEKGKVLFTRSGDTTAALQVQYQIKGKLVNGSDYEFLPGALTIPAGAFSAKLKIKPRAGAGHRGTSNLRIFPTAPMDGSFVVEPEKVKIQFVNSR